MLLQLPAQNYRSVTKKLKTDLQTNQMLRCLVKEKKRAAEAKFNECNNQSRRM